VGGVQKLQDGEFSVQVCNFLHLYLNRSCYVYAHIHAYAADAILL
jgi:hypothetical protein